MPGEQLRRIDQQLAEAIAADHELELRAIDACQEGQREWLVSEIAGLSDARAIIRRLL